MKKNNNCGNSCNDCCDECIDKKRCCKDVKYMINQLTKYKIDFNEKIQNLRTTLNNILPVATSTNSDNFIDVPLLYNYYNDKLKLISKLYSSLNKYIIDFISCFYKLYPKEKCIYYTNIICKLYNITNTDSYDKTIDFLKYTISPLSIQPEVIRPIVQKYSIQLISGSTELLNNVSNDIYDLLIYIIGIINLLPKIYAKKCKLAKCLLNDNLLFFYMPILGINSVNIQPLNFSDFNYSQTNAITNVMLYSALFPIYKKVFCCEYNCEVYRLLYLLTVYVLKYILISGPIPYNFVFSSSTNQTPPTENVVVIDIDNCKLNNLAKLVGKINTLLCNC